MTKKAGKTIQSDDKKKKTKTQKAKKDVVSSSAPAVQPASKDAANAPVPVSIGGQVLHFDIENPVLPSWIDENALASGGFPYDKKLDEKKYLEELELLQIELVKLQEWQAQTKARVVVVFEGRDAAGKGGTINAMRENMNPRSARNVALPKPNDTERGQWYFQRYAAQMPTAGEFVTFDRSWYNRAGVEPVMGFCTPAQYEEFLEEAPNFEKMLVSDGIFLFKIWLDIGREMQLKRFHERKHSVLRHWKFSPMDVAGISKWNDYSAKRDVMFKRTHSKAAPWTIIRSNDKRRARLEAIRLVLDAIDYAHKDPSVIGKADPKIIGQDPKLASK
ncbi:MAG: polyphosphate kinase 2 [Rhizobiaceae bacterium]